MNIKMIEKPVVNEAFIITWNRKLLGVSGAWPEPYNKHKNLSKFLSILNAMNMIVFLIIPQTVFMFTIWPDFELINESLMLTNFCEIMVLLKLIVVCRRKKDLENLVASIYEDWNRTKSEFELRIMRKNAEIAKFIALYCFCTVMSATSLHFLEQVALNIRRQKENRDWLFVSYFPFSASKSPVYELTFLLQASGAFLSTFIYTGLLSFCSMLILHVHSQFSILEHNLELLINSNNFSSHRDFLLKLKVIVVEHEHLNRFATVIEDTFNQVFFVEMIAYIMQLSLQLYHVMLLNKSGSITPLDVAFWLAFVFTIIANLFVVCYLGEKLKISTVKLQFSLYRSEWYNLTTLEAKNLLMLFLRTEIPLELTAGKLCVFSYETFAMIIKKSVAILSVLLTMQQKMGA